MVIALNEVAAEGFVSRLVILAVVGVLVTVVVYGVVALIVKIDDIGVRLTERSSTIAQKVGRGMVKGMPHLLAVISVIGTAAMIWVGGHIELIGLDELGWHAPYDLVHHLEEAVHGVPAVGGFLGWLVNTTASAILGLVVGALVVLVMHLLPFGRKDEATGH